MEISKFKSAPISTQFEFNGEMLNLKVNADLLTAEFLEEMEAATEGAAGISATVRQANFMIGTVARAVVEWDLTNNDQPLPVSADVLRQLPQAVVSGLFGAVMGTGVPKPPTAETSADG